MAAAYVPNLSQMLHLVAPDIKMWGIVLAMSMAPLILGLVVTSFGSWYLDKKHRRTNAVAM